MGDIQVTEHALDVVIEMTERLRVAREAGLLHD